MFFIDKYSPSSVEDVFFNKNILEHLKIISKDESVPHTIFYGPPGSGKKTIIKLFLEMLYDETVHNTDDSMYKVSGSGNNETNVIVKQSNYHIVIEPNNNNFDRYLIQEVVQEYAKRMPLNIFSVKKVFKTVLINNVDNLSYYAQTALRRMMEKYSDTCRFILWCRSLSKVIEPLNSRCLSIRIPSPSDAQIFQHIYKISIEENIKLDITDYTKIIDMANGNIKTSLWLLELKKYGHDFKNIYDRQIAKTVNIMLRCEIDSVIQIRDIVYNIMITNINKTKILKDILDCILQNEHITIDCKYDIVREAGIYEYNLMRCRREIVHFEAFFQKVIYILYHSKEYVIPSIDELYESEDEIEEIIKVKPSVNKKLFVQIEQ
jgi:replication factor C subunit 3/5